MPLHIPSCVAYVTNDPCAVKMLLLQRSGTKGPQQIWLKDHNYIQSCMETQELTTHWKLLNWFTFKQKHILQMLALQNTFLGDNSYINSFWHN